MERRSVCELDVIVALVDAGVPIQSVEPTPRILIFLIVAELGQ